MKMIVNIRLKVNLEVQFVSLIPFQGLMIHRTYLELNNNCLTCLILHIKKPEPKDFK
jgi:hypothetical protein